MSVSRHHTSRRDFLRASVLAGAVFGADRSLSATATRKAAANLGSARNVILMVSDGMNHGTLSLSRQYQTLILRKEAHWNRLYREQPVVRCLSETFSANSCVTDSAAAASAWGGGRRVPNGVLNILADGTGVPPLHGKLRKAGRRTGLVTTATITHATPAGFAANVDSRADEALIARQYLDRRVDVLLGGGQKFFGDELRQEYTAAGYDVFDNRQALKRARHDALKPMLGIFSEGHHPFSIDRDHVPAIAGQVPTLAEMAQAALDRLRHAPDGFFLLVEGARIDHAGHANDAAASIHDQAAFDDAIGAVLAFIGENPDTLLIITTDHGCGGIQMNGVSAKADQGFAPGVYNASNACFDRMRGFTRSFEWMKQNGLGALSGPKLAAAIRQFTGIELDADQLKLAQGLKPGVGRAFQAHTGIGWTSGSHTGELVELCAYGPGSRDFPAFIRNFEVHDLILKALGIAV
ncbi:MAG: alkaline phosphatase [Akkermansiaceae bacterium]|nr:alkaline phosphatase [Akkermansiaceae bacterium]